MRLLRGPRIPLVVAADQADEHETAQRYLDTFAPRRDAYQTFYRSWIARREPLTPDVILDAFRGGWPIGIYLTTADGLTSVGAIDFDDQDRGWQQAIDTARALEARDIPCAISRSARGAHLWVVIAERLPLSWVRGALSQGLADVGLRAGRESKIELRPASDRPAPGSLSAGLRAPFMPHPTTGEVHPLLRPTDLEPLGSSVASALRALGVASPDAIHMAGAQRDRLKAGEGAASPASAVPDHVRRITAYKDKFPITHVLKDELGMEARAGATISCPFHDDRRPSFTIAANNKRVWCNAVSCPFYNERTGHDAWDLRAFIRQMRSPARQGAERAVWAP